MTSEKKSIPIGGDSKAQKPTSMSCLIARFVKLKSNSCKALRQLYILKEINMHTAKSRTMSFDERVDKLEILNVRYEELNEKIAALGMAINTLHDDNEDDNSNKNRQ